MEKGGTGGLDLSLMRNTLKEAALLEGFWMVSEVVSLC